MIFICKFEPKEKKKIKKIKLQLKNIKEKIKIDIAHQNFILLHKLKL
jgi:hypothetical protein